jgi:hypothetical protein
VGLEGGVTVIEGWAHGKGGRLLVSLLQIPPAVVERDLADNTVTIDIGG